MAKSDIFGNSVGDMLVMNASDAEIVSKNGGLGFVLNATINYSRNIQPVATFGADTLFALGAPQGSFNFGTVAGNGILKLALQNCYGQTLAVTFNSSNCAGAPASGKLKEITKNNSSTYTMNGAFTAGLQIQGQAQDAFFTQNVNGIFHYLS